MPLIGPSVDRRTLALLQRAVNKTVKSLVCFVCAQIHTFMNDDDANWNIRYESGALFEKLEGEDLKMLDLNCGLMEFRKRYAQGGKDEGNVFSEAPEFDDNAWEWKRRFA